MNKKIWVALLVMLLMITGCGQKTTDKGEKGEKPVLRQLGFPRNFDPNGDPVAKVIEDATGYKVEYEILPMENATDKLNLMMANKEKIDIIKVRPEQYHKLASEGALEPLDDLLKEYGKTLLEVNTDEAWKAAKIDGVTYGIPEQASRPFVSSAIAVRTGLLEEMGIDSMPETLEEFYALLVRIKKETDMIPLTGATAIVDEISGAFGVNSEWTIEDGKVKHIVEREGLQEYIEFMQKLSEEGLLDPEWPINDVPKIQEKFTSGKAAFMANYNWGFAGAMTEALQSNFPNEEIEMVMGLKGPKGLQGAFLQSTGVNFYIAIPKASDHKEEAMKFMDAKVQPELFKNLSIGEKGVHWEEKDGKMQPILPAFTDERNNADWFNTSTDYNAYREYWLLRTRKEQILGETFDKMQVQVDYAEENPLAMAPPLEVPSKYAQKLKTMMDDYIINAIFDKGSAPSYEEFLKRFMAEGGQESIDAYNEWYQEYLKQD